MEELLPVLFAAKGKYLYVSLPNSSYTTGTTISLAVSPVINDPFLITVCKGLPSPSKYWVVCFTSLFGLVNIVSVLVIGAIASQTRT